ncbi:BBE domain-containing protein [Mangrovicoccus ximenensis]|uniref:BBE domain-containing protein n=1 Tax=Mangrovicoccus ximenensis TaxID=1911570 RepID=UPI00191BDBBF
MRLGVAFFATMNVMLLSISVWAGAEGATRDLFHWISALIALPTVAFAGQPFYRNAFAALRRGALNMDVPITLAIVLTIATSLYETIQSGAHAYFDATLMLCFFLLAGRYLDHRTRAVARSAAEELAALEVARATRLRDGIEETVTQAELAVGDLIRGCTQADLDRAASPFGLAVPAGIVSSTGIAGLTLGGGHGYLTRAHGLTIDNLLEAQVVLADGRIVTASGTTNPDLFWALRGGGGNFGVVTEFTYRAHPAGEVFAGPVFYDIAHAAEIMRWYRDALSGMPRELAVFLGLKTVPSTDPFPRDIWGRRICALIVCYNGPEAEGRRAMQPIHDALPDPLMNGMSVMRFADLQAMFDPLLPKGMQWYWKGDYVTELTDAAIAAHVAHGSRSPSELSLMHLYPIDGAVHEVAPDATAWGARNQKWSMVIAGIDPDPAKADELAAWAKAYWEAVHAENGHGGSYVNFMMADEGQGRIRAAYGGNYDRLAEVKRRYDPENLFHINQNIRP